MATTKVSALAETTSPQANDELLLNQSGVSKKVKITNLGIGTPADNSVSTQKIANDAVTIAKLNLISTSSAPSLEAKGTSGSTSGYIKLNCSENSHGIKLLGPPHSAGANYTLTFPNNDGNSSQVLTTNGSGVLTWTTPSSTDSTKMPLAGGAFSGAVTTNSTIDGRDVNADGILATNALPKGGGTMTGDLVLGDNVRLEVGSLADGDMVIYHDGSNSYIDERGTGQLNVRSSRVDIKKYTGETMAQFVADDGCALFFNNVAKISTTAAGATIAGNIAVTGTVDGVDIQTLNTTASAALPKAGGTMTGNVNHADNARARFGAGNDLQIWHDGSNSYIADSGTGDLIIEAAANLFLSNISGEKYLRGIADGAVDIYHNNVVKLATSANGVTVTGGAVGTMTTDNDGSFALSASNNFKCTPAANFALTFTAIVAQSGNILFINSGGKTISAHANTKVDATFLATISTAGTYLLSYFSDGTNVYMTNSAAYA